MQNLDELDVVIRRKRGKIVALIPQLRLYAKGDDVLAALASLEEKKKALIADLDELGETLKLDSQPGAGRTGTPFGAAGIGPFAIKPGIVAAAVAAVMLISGVFVATSIDNSIREAVGNVKDIKIGGAMFWSRVEQTLDRLAAPETDMPADKKAKLLSDIRAIGTKWRPFLVEIRSALDVQDSRAPAPPHKQIARTIALDLVFVNLGRVPERVHFGEGGVLRRLAARGESAFDNREAPLELEIGLPQQVFRIGTQVAGEVDHSE